MAADRDDFLRRWSRRKLDAGAQAPAPAPAPAAGDPVPTLPSLDSLTFESDFKDFMHAKVDESVRRAALKTLFTDPRFNVIDFMDVYIDDYTNLESIPPEMLARLEHSRTTLFGRGEESKQDDAKEAKSEAETQSEVPAQATAPDADPGLHTEEQKRDDGAAG